MTTTITDKDTAAGINLLTGVSTGQNSDFYLGLIQELWNNVDASLRDATRTACRRLPQRHGGRREIRV
ncbi:hypothetical protein [Nostoc sp.]|uniref:hypothetical protein n=1 Tax=Nostoc sp. TaxID=1180 RepID=UPI002FFA4A1E